MDSKIPGDFAEKKPKIPRKIIFLTFAAIVVTAAVFAFLPQRVTFSYASDTCINDLTVLPNQRKTTEASRFQVSYPTVYGGVFATKTCFTPTAMPEAGSASVSSGLLGQSWLGKTYTLTVPSAPAVAGVVTKTPIAVTKPVLFAMNAPDKIFEYQLASTDKNQPCTVSGKNLECKVDKLGLAQGSEHTLTLQRIFKTSKPAVVTTAKVSVLPAVTVTDSSVKPGQVVYDKPKTISFTVDKPLRSAKAILELVEGDKKTPVTTTVSVSEKTVTVAFEQDLAREKQFNMRLTQAEATDGSTINEPVVVAFSTSGGPKVTGVNIGATGVDSNARVVVTFDQPLADTVDITKFARIEGVSAAVSSQGAQVIFALQSAPRCAAFTLRVTKGITSATNGLTSTADWAYTSRVNCRTTAVIGYSVKGRPIVAYYYGGGGTTVLFTGGMHGSEPSGMQTMQAWATYLDTNAPKIPADKQVVIVPNTNPDGISARTRLNANGVNIDRNFATSDWSPDIQTTSGTLKGGGGSAPMSEPETRAIANLTAQVRPRIEVSFHAAGRLVGANDYGDSRTIGSLYASTVGYSTMFGGTAEDVMGYSFSGQYEDWIAQKLGKPAILVELPTASGNYLNSQLPALWKMVNL